MITLTNNEGVRNVTVLDFTWTTDEGAITYVLHLKPLVAGVFDNAYHIQIPVTSVDASIVGNVWTYTVPEEYYCYFYNAKIVYNWWITGTSTSNYSKFVWKPAVYDTEYTVNKLPSQVTDPTIYVTGTYTTSISKIFVNGVLSEMLESGKWRCPIRLSPGLNNIIVVAEDRWGISSRTSIIKTELYTSSGAEVNYWTHYDEYGAWSGFYRDTGEGLYSFEKYRSQSLKYRGAGSLIGLLYGMSNELRTDIIPAIKVFPLRNSFSELLLSVDCSSIYYSTNLMESSESGTVDEFARITTTYSSIYEYVIIYIDNKVIPVDEVVDKCISIPVKYANKKYTISYRYYGEISKNMTISTLLTALNATGIFDACFMKYVDTSKSAYNICPQPWKNDLTLMYSEVQVYNAGDSGTQERYASQQSGILEYDVNTLNPTHSFVFPGSEIDGLTDEILTRGGYGWSNIVIDQSYWTLTSYMSYSVLPRVYDSMYRRYNGYIPPAAEYLGISTYNGVIDFTGGVPFEDDLEVTL